MTDMHIKTGLGYNIVVDTHNDKHAHTLSHTHTAILILGIKMIAIKSLFSHRLVSFATWPSSLAIIRHGSATSL